MKVLRICLIIGYFALAIGAILYLINLIMAEEVISMAIVVPFYAIALVGIVCGIIFVVQGFRKKCKEIEAVAEAEETEAAEEPVEAEAVEEPAEAEAAEESVEAEVAEEPVEADEPEKAEEPETL